MNEPRNSQIKTLYRELCENRPIDHYTNKPMSKEDIRYVVGEKFGLAPETIRTILISMKKNENPSRNHKRNEKVS